MATEKQIAANRANAQKSTGPKTAAGRLKSSRNAFRHGLSLPLRLDIATSEKADAIARLLTPDQADGIQLTAATEVAQAQLELLRIRAVRAELMSAVESASGNLQHLQRLAALDRYERFAHTKRRRASRKLQVPDKGG
jgi:hypothetical protein